MLNLPATAKRLASSPGLSRLLGVVILVITFVSGWLLFDYHAFLDQPLVGQQVAVTHVIKHGTSLSGFARDLQRRGLIEHPRYLVLYGRLSGQAQHIQAGEYEFEAGITPRQLFHKVVSGKVIQYPVTLIEGWTFQQVRDALQPLPWLKHTLDTLTVAECAARLGIAGDNPEGWLLPDTYHVARGTTDLEVLQMAHQAMEDYLASAWPGRAAGLPYDSPYDALILASIVEKETAVPEERAEIAGVFVRRLQKHMRLQTDPTVIYGLGEDFDGNLRRRDLKRDTPYNSYTRSGLPPTPIAMPGTASIDAALHPDDGDALYFVARGDGSHYFSATHEEHVRAVRKYQLKR